MTDANAGISVGIWGTGSSAIEAVRILGLNPKRVFSSDGGGTFAGLPVEPGSLLDESIDALFVCSIHYSDIVRKIKEQGFPLNRVRVFHGHLIHPNYLLNEVLDFERQDFFRARTRRVLQAT